MRKQILVADDSRSIRHMLKKKLTEWGYEVIEAASGEAAWALYEKNEFPPLAIIDWMMPGMEGIEICRNIAQASSRNIPYRILVTSRDKKADIVHGLQAGAHDYITKPFDIQELLSRIQVGEQVVALEMALEERIQELEEAMEHIKTLQGLLPICMHCHKIRNDHECWERLEDYLSKNLDVMLSHSLCPECAEKHYSHLLNPNRKYQQAMKE